MASPAGRVYQHAADILERIRARRGTAKGLCLGAPIAEKKKLYALVCETVKYMPVIVDVIEAVGLRKAVKEIRPAMAQVLVYDMLFGRGIQCGGRLKRLLTPHQQSLRAALDRLVARRGVANARALVDAEAGGRTPRYVRVNLVKWDVDSAVAAFASEGFALVAAPAALTSLAPRTFCRDTHLSDLLVFAPGTDLHAHPSVADGRAVLQDKASCFPAWVLCAPPGATVIDACAAPGNKTTHVASLMNNTGNVFAFEIDARRVKLLRTFVSRAGATCVESIHGSFLDADPNDARFCDVTHILLDPSCSGSGIPGRDADALLAGGADGGNGDAERLASLSDFQLSVIRHAFQFPSVRRVSYSTCSVHAVENEDVVARALASAEGAAFKLEKALPQWPSRGLADRPDGDLCVRATSRDHTNGFFVALFVRIEGGAPSANVPRAVPSVASASRRENVAPTVPLKAPAARPPKATAALNSTAATASGTRLPQRTAAPIARSETQGAGKVRAKKKRLRGSNVRQPVTR